jgi:hypothetical protein
MQDDSEYRIHRAGAQCFRRGDEVAGRVVDERIESPHSPERLNCRLDLTGVANIADVPGDSSRKLARELRYRFLEHVLSAAADHHRRAQFEKASAHALTKTGTAAGDEYALSAQKI